MILRRYIIRQCLTITILVSCILLLISMISQLNIYLLAVANGSLEARFLLPILISFAPQYMSVVLPLSFFIAVIITLNRLQKNNELIVMSVCGLDRNFLIRLFWPLAAVLFALALLLSLFVTPYSTSKAQAIISFQENRASWELITPKTFVTLDQSTTIYAESLSQDKQILNNVYLFIKPEKDEKESQLIYAQNATTKHNDKERYLHMGQGYQIRVVPGEANMIRTRFDSVSIRLPPRDRIATISRKEALDNTSLLASGDPKLYQFFYWRLSIALFVPILFIMALYMFTSTARQDNSARNFLVLFFSCLAYVGANTAVFSLASNGTLAPEPAYASIHLVAIAGAIFYHRITTRI